MKNTYSTKEIAQIAGVSIHTLRYYESIGLLDPVDRLQNGHRRYDDNDVNRLDFIKRLKATRMPISEMVYYVELFRAGESTIIERREILEAHREQVQEQIELLMSTMELLNRKIENYRRREENRHPETA